MEPVAGISSLASGGGWGELEDLRAVVTRLACALISSQQLRDMLQAVFEVCIAEHLQKNHVV